MTILISIFNIICIATGFFSYRAQAYMAGLLSPKIEKRIFRIQNVSNYFLACILLLLSILQYLRNIDILWFGCVYIVQLLANGIYVATVFIWSRHKRKCMVLISLVAFLDIYKNTEFENDKVLIDLFCREYRECSRKEAARALYSLRRR